MTRPSRPFWDFVDRQGADDCWPWVGHIRRTGYGEWRPKAGTKKWTAHRVAYELDWGPIPEGLVLDHLCRNRACCNPRHLEPVTIGENVLRGETISARYAARSACGRGHLFTPENLKKDRGRGRECRACDLDRKRASRRAT